MIKTRGMKLCWEKETDVNFLVLIICLLLCSFAGNVHAAECGTHIIYEGKGAGQVVFDGTVHTSKGLTCSACHDQHGFSSALFEMKKGATVISMRKMQLGSSCGYCHDGSQAFSATDYLLCSNCHHK
jgi:thiosulfate reductase cytochrome b subunit